MLVEWRAHDRVADCRGARPLSWNVPGPVNRDTSLPDGMTAFAHLSMTV